MPAPSGHADEDQLQKAEIVEISRYLMECGGQPCLRTISNKLEEFGKNCWLRGFRAKHRPESEED